MRCKSCGGELPSHEFYKSNQSACKSCVRARVIQNRQDNLAYYQEYDRLRGRTPERKKKVKDHYNKMIKDPEWRADRWRDRKKWLENNPEARAAHIVVGNAVRDGKLLKSPCAVCGKSKVDAHHEDYKKPLAVIWLCKQHHMERHRK